MERERWYMRRDTARLSDGMQYHLRGAACAGLHRRRSIRIACVLAVGLVLVPGARRDCWLASFRSGRQLLSDAAPLDGSAVQDSDAAFRGPSPSASSGTEFVEPWAKAGMAFVASLVACVYVLCSQPTVALAEEPQEKNMLPPPLESASSQRALKLGEALKERRAILFGTYWCPYCNLERQELGRDVFEPKSEGEKPLVKYVECDPRGLDGRPDFCRAVGVRSFPTWAMRASEKDATVPYELYTGRRGLYGLESITGLPSPPDPDAVIPAVTGKSGAREIAVAEALKSQGATMYGTYWCGYCDKQRQLFGKEAWAKVPYVECDPRAAGSQPKACDAKGVGGYPTWVLGNGEKLVGIVGLEALEETVQKVDASGAAAAKTSTGKSKALPKPGDEACEDCKVPGGVGQPAAAKAA
eukprot:TRINITY_DN74272_c0_g1_i1.p1 TRINITY_DN74272_c0_g1~~TRINITY_DN74272_c0_g1_i1.p1  ORF type:complete len:413 (-),score=84.88 TRINITY_DN74272_c0_g1_i1:138-1376(-)